MGKVLELKTVLLVGTVCLILGFLACLVVLFISGIIPVTVNNGESVSPINVSVIYVPCTTLDVINNENFTLPVNVPTYYIPCAPPEPKGYFIVYTETSVSEPYYISKTPPTFEVGDWVRSNSEYKHHIKTEFQGQIIEIDDDNVSTVRLNTEEYKYIHKDWLEHWICEMVIHDPDIGYYCYTRLIDKTHIFNENSTLVSVIYKNVNN